VLLKISMMMKCSILLSVVFCAVLIRSASAGSDIVLPCGQQYPDDDAARLKCYDRLAAPASALIPAVRESIVPDENSEASNTPVTSAAVPTRSPERSDLTKAWNLDNLSDLDPSKLGRIQPYRQTYLLLANRTSNTNRQPSSPLPDHNVSTPSDLDVTEVKFQLSFKADIGQQRNVNFLGIKTFRFWGAYTQQSYWQAYNLRNSSPYRETVYEPEFIATLGTGHESGLKLINLGLVHQSNGRSLPESRGWYRIYLLGGWEWNDMTSIMLRGWWRIPENPLKDDNPDISNYLGRGDLTFAGSPGINRNQSPCCCATI
jgi:phospholipase A1/A2